MERADTTALTAAPDTAEALTLFSVPSETLSPSEAWAQLQALDRYENATGDSYVIDVHGNRAVDLDQRRVDLMRVIYTGADATAWREWITYEVQEHEGAIALDWIRAA